MGSNRGSNPGSTDNFAWDEKLTGFGLRERNGKRSWIIQYRHGHKQRRLKIGDAEKLTKAQARDLARKRLAEVVQGRDPAADKQQDRKDRKFTLGVIVADYLDVKRTQVRANSFNEIARYLTDTWQPLHGIPINAITRRDIAHELGKMTRKNGSTTAARARSALSTFYAWAMGEGLAESNPIIGTNKPAQPPARERVLSDAELAAIWNGAPEYNYGRIVKLLILTGCRREEIGGLKWSEVDTDRHVIQIPGERTKNHRAHELPLSDLAWSIIPERNDDEFVFGHERGRAGFTGWSRGKADLDERLGQSVKEKWRLHDARRTVATRMADLGVMPHVIEAVLGHYSGHKAGVAGIYNRALYEKQVREALLMWSNHVRAVVEGGERKVLHIPRPAS
jgi:integrase